MEEDLKCTVKHPDIIEKVKKTMPDEETLFDIAELFKVFGDSTRMKIICCLFEHEMCVCDIAELINSTQSAVSHQLRVLKQAKLVKLRKDGKTVYYSLSDEHVEMIFNIYETDFKDKIINDEINNHLLVYNYCYSLINND